MLRSWAHSGTSASTLLSKENINLSKQKSILCTLKFACMLTNPWTLSLALSVIPATWQLWKPHQEQNKDMFFHALDNGTFSSTFVTLNVSKSQWVIYYNTLLGQMLRSKRETPTITYAMRSATTKEFVYVFPLLALYCASVAHPTVSFKARWGLELVQTISKPGLINVSKAI